jgi:hypothetical protein
MYSGKIAVPPDGGSKYSLVCHQLIQNHVRLSPGQDLLLWRDYNTRIQ